MARADRRHPVGGDDDALQRAQQAETAPNPVWFKPVMVGFMLLGLAWILVFYLSGMQYPIPGIQAWNLVIGFLMTTRWR